MVFWYRVAWCMTSDIETKDVPLSLQQNQSENIKTYTFRQFTLKYNRWKKYITYSILTPWCRVLLEKLTGLQLVKKFPAFYGTRRFITEFTSVRHLSLSWASPIQSTYPHPTSWRSILVLSTYLRLGLPSGLFPSGFPTKTLYTPSPHPYATHAQPISFFSILSPAQLYICVCVYIYIYTLLKYANKKM